MQNKPRTQVHFFPILHWYFLLLLKHPRMQLDISTSKEVLMRNIVIDGQQLNCTFIRSLFMYVEINVMQMMYFFNILLTSIRTLTYALFYKMFQCNTSMLTIHGSRFNNACFWKKNLSGDKLELVYLDLWTYIKFSVYS